MRELRCKSKLPFTPDSKQVVYVEEAYNHRINSFISANYKLISETLQQEGYDFCYIPALIEQFKTQEYLDFYTPYQHHACGDEINSTFLHPYILDSEQSPCAAFILYNHNKTCRRWTVFSCFDIDENQLDLSVMLGNLLEHVRLLKKESGRILCCSSYCISLDKGSDENYADDNFYKETMELMDEVRNKIERLRQCGVSEMVLKSLLEPKIKLSSLHIDKMGRITLPYYDNREIKMTPLVKAVYILFLRHEEGIIFKRLPEYRKELATIYNRLTGRSSDEAIRKSIEDVTNPCSNSINEKCTRIREAFLREFDESIAENYYILGRRGEPKRIFLPRYLINDFFG